LTDEDILDHYRSPHNKTQCCNATHRATAVNDACGDVIEISLIVNDGIINQAHFTGSGCVMSQSAASMLAERVEGMWITDAAGLSESDVTQGLSNGMSPAKLKCFLVSLNALRDALK
jgi:nitrogen fixation NifU-like protein